jgi:hypothetical protein
MMPFRFLLRSSSLAQLHDIKGGVRWNHNERVTLKLLHVLPLLVAAACGPTPVPLDDAWFACEPNDECVGVPAGDVCIAGACASAAINRASFDDYGAAFDAARDTCLFIENGDGSCEDTNAACLEGRCVLEPI